ncbi:MAG TPA: RsmD family RNA methyltransferase [Chloroflexota bacterium]|nr:RsmD family RNA methyltransferase [Chloroflexota bacterium]
MRVIAGSARGTLLRAPKDAAIRPTADKLKGAIFSMLEAEAFKRGVMLPPEAPPGALLVGAAWPVVLDLYAGSGALGIEALSRGARWADFVEPDPAARQAIEYNLQRTRLADRAAIHAITAEQAVSTWSRTYDLILLDPPYDDPSALRVFEALGRSPLVGPSTVVVYEHARGTVLPSEVGRLRLAKTRYHGGSGVSLYFATDDAVDRRD